MAVAFSTRRYAPTAYSGHNDHNYFEIAHTVKRLYEMGGNKPDGLKLYNFADNHDVERIYTKLNNKNHFVPVHILMYTLPGVPSVYYGSEFGIEGQKQRGSDDSLRPEISYGNYVEAVRNSNFAKLISRLGEIRKESKALSYGDYKELILTTGQYAFSRNYNGVSVIVTVNNSDEDFVMKIPAQHEEYVGGLFGEKINAQDGHISVNIKENSGEIWLPVGVSDKQIVPIVIEKAQMPTLKETEKREKAEETQIVEEPEAKGQEPGKANKSFEEMSVEELQGAILARMAKNGPVTEQMRKDVMENVYHNSLVTWIKSFG